MIKFAQFIFLIALSKTAHADSFYKLIRYNCDRQNDRVTVSYLDAYNDRGEDLVENKGKDAWEPSKLIDIDASGERIAKLRVIKKRCHLSDGVYNVTMGPKVFSGNINGRCGNIMSIAAWIKITKAGRFIARREFEDDCVDNGSPIIVEVSLTARAKEAILKQASHDEFFR